MNKHIQDALEDVMLYLAIEVYNKHDEIYREASEGLLDDDHEQVDMNVSDILLEMVREKLQ